MITETHEWINTAINFLVAVGTLLAVAVALWGDHVRAWLRPAKLRLEFADNTGIWTRPEQGQARFFYRHLRVVNDGALAHRCRVLLREIYERQGDGNWKQLPMPVPFQMPWAPFGIVPAEVEISHDQVLDFGFLSVPRTPAAAITPHFKPALYAYPD